MASIHFHCKTGVGSPAKVVRYWLSVVDGHITTYDNLYCDSVERAKNVYMENKDTPGFKWELYLKKGRRWVKQEDL